MPIYLHIIDGPHAGAKYRLDEQFEYRLGRGEECSIRLEDPLCSRVHARLAFRNGHWQIVDNHSRNGLLVNGQKTEDATLDSSHTFKIGGSAMVLRDEADAKPNTGATSIDITQSIVKSLRISDHRTDTIPRDPATAILESTKLEYLKQLSFQLLACREPNEVIRSALETLRSRTGSTVVGFLYLGENRHLEPRIVLPETTRKPIALNDALTRLVCEEQRAIWVSNSPEGRSKVDLSIRIADAICVPLVSDETVLGAIHLYLDTGQYQSWHYDFAVEVAQMTAIAYARSGENHVVAHEFQRLKDTSPGYEALVGECPAMHVLREKIQRVAQTNNVVLVRGESGTGKELIARAIHARSLRHKRPMLTVNCAAIPDDLMESQLFGHKAGAFTGADRDQVGLFQQADMGTLFLDEIGELSLAGQSKLLRILDGQPFLPLGAAQQVHVDVRVIAATNRDLVGYVREKKFRADLYYRLAVYELVSPPLRDRDGDLDRLIDYFLDHFTRQHSRPLLKLSPTARQKLRDYSWPGNVRQLRNVIDSAVVLAAGDVIEPRDLGLHETVEQGELDTLRIDHWERRLMVEALKRTGDNIPEAAKLLGIGRATLYRKLEEYGLKKGS